MSQRQPLRVVQLLHTMAHGGVETALLNWLVALRRDEVDTRVVVFANPDGGETAFIEAASRIGVDVIRIPWGRFKPVLSSARHLAAYLRREKIDIVHCHNTYANAVGLLAGRLAGCRTLATYYVWGDFGFKRNVLQWFDRLLMHRFDQISAHCEQCYSDTLALGADPSRLHLLICGYPARQVHLDAAERARGRAELGASEHDTVFIYMARFWPEKAHENLLDAFQRLLAAQPRAKLWLPGVGPDRDAIQRLCAQMGLDPAVRFLGFHPDPDRLLALADIQVHPSDNEGVALAICAGMAAARPIIASRVGGLEEVLKDDRSAILIPPRDPQRLADEMLGLIRDPERAARLGCEARRFILEDYSVEVAVNRLRDVYRRMINGRHA